MCSAAINFEPEVAIYYGNRAAASFMLGRYKEALEDSQTSVKLDSSYVRGYQRAGKALITVGRLDEVQALKQAVMNSFPLLHADLFYLMILGSSMVNARQLRAVIVQLSFAKTCRTVTAWKTCV